ncbi:MAG: 16S rRNA (cytosine(967)-C(5))-methyltransferase, partial [Gammaproteobacteria bacterium]
MSELKSGARLRAAAAKAIDAVVSEGRSLDAVLAELDERINPGDRALVKMLCYGTLRFHWRLRAQLRQLVDRPLKARDSVIESLLAVGLFQLSDTRVPDHAAVSTTVEAARLLRRPKYKGLINAVMRNYLRKDMKNQEPADDESRFNHPAWLIGRLQADWPEHWQQILEANNDRAPMWLRVNRQHMSAGQYIEEFAVDGHELDGLEQAVRLSQPLPVEELPGFSEGRVSVQDGAAQLAAPWLLAAGGTSVLDACAAPGGKTGHLLELMAPDAVLTAIDQDAQRLRGVAENLARLRLDATVMAGDASNTKDWW